MNLFTLQEKTLPRLIYHIHTGEFISQHNNLPGNSWCMFCWCFSFIPSSASLGKLW